MLKLSASSSSNDPSSDAEKSPLRARFRHVPTISAKKVASLLMVEHPSLGSMAEGVESGCCKSWSLNACRSGVVACDVSGMR